MKRRYRYLLNLLSVGLLLFALYLNFIKKEAVDITAPDVHPATSQLQQDSKPSTVQQTTSTIVLK